eukprot:SAG11_NODE_23159_length_394_cov_0.694915_1_plen_106_part_01
MVVVFSYTSLCDTRNSGCHNAGQKCHNGATRPQNENFSPTSNEIARHTDQFTLKLVAASLLPLDNKHDTVLLALQTVKPGLCKLSYVQRRAIEILPETRSSCMRVL